MFPWIFLTILGIVFAAAYGYRYYKDRDKRKLMFTFAFIIASFGYLPQIQAAVKVVQHFPGVFNWSVLPLMFAVSIAVFSSLLKLDSFDKSFKIFSLTLAGSIFLMIGPPTLDFLRPIYSKEYLLL